MPAVSTDYSGLFARTRLLSTCDVCGSNYLSHAILALSSGN